MLTHEKCSSSIPCCVRACVRLCECVILFMMHIDSYCLKTPLKKTEKKYLY